MVDQIQIIRIPQYQSLNGLVIDELGTKLFRSSQDSSPNQSLPQTNVTYLFSICLKVNLL